MSQFDVKDCPCNVIYRADGKDLIGLAIGVSELNGCIIVRPSSHYPDRVFRDASNIVKCSFDIPEVGDTLVVSRDIDEYIPKGTHVVVTKNDECKYNGFVLVQGAAVAYGTRVSVFDLRTVDDWGRQTDPEYDQNVNFFQIECSSKPTNPKDAVGQTKTPIHLVPAEVIQGIAEALYEGSLKYGRENYLEAGVRYSTYYSATLRHLLAWFSGEDIDPDSGLEHLAKALASISVLYSAIHRGVPSNTDDRSIATLNDAKLTIANLNRKFKNETSSHS